MIDKIVDSAADALRDVPDGATVMIGGFGTAGMPSELIDAVTRNFPVVCVAAPVIGVAALLVSAVISDARYRRRDL